MRCACGYDDHGTGDSAHFCVVASPVQGACKGSATCTGTAVASERCADCSPVQGAASASGEAKGTAVKPWRERHAESIGVLPPMHYADAEIADWRALAERAQAQPSAIEYDRIVKADERAMRAVDALDGMGFTYDDEIGWLPPAPEQEAAQVERECTCPSGNGSLAWPCPQHPPGDVMRPFGAPAGQHDAIAEARARLEAKWDAEGDCGSCGWHAALYEHNVEDSEIAEALEKNGGILELSCVSKDDDDSASHRGVKINIAAPPEQSAAGGSREGRDGCTKSGASSTAFDDQYAEDPTGAANTNQPEGVAGEQA